MNSLTPGPDITIAEKLQTTATAKTNIATAITNKGGTVPTKFSDYGTAVSSLPNTYTAGDEGKVVSNGALVSQTSLTITENNTYDTTTKNSVTVNVSGGGGGGGPFLEVVTRQASPTWTVSASDLAGATTIGSYTFRDCDGLTSITIPDSVTSIGDYAFYGCSGLTSIPIPSGVTSIGSSAFYNCTNLTSITIPNGVTNIGGYAFYNCFGLTSITIPDSVTQIAKQAFYNCTNLATIDFGTTRSTIPTLVNVNAFQGLPANYRILVPSSLLDTWKATSNWNNSAVVDHIVAHT